MAFYTDLAYEKCTGEKIAKLNDKLKYGCEEVVININSSQKQQKYGLNKGNYYMLECPNLNLLASVVREYIVDQITNYLKTTFKKKLRKSNAKILVVGLGNQYLTCDSLGVKVARGLIVNVNKKDAYNLMSFCPGVLGQTGIDTASLIKSIVTFLKPDIVILVDSLCAISTSRLGCVIQITDAGLVAGGVTGEQGQIINTKYLGVPTISIGVPLVVRTDTIVGEVLEGLSEQMLNSDEPALKKVSNLLVSPVELDELVRINAEIIAYAINNAVHNVKEIY